MISSFISYVPFVCTPTPPSAHTSAILYKYIELKTTSLKLRAFNQRYYTVVIVHRSKTSPSDTVAKRPRTASSVRSTSCSPPTIGRAIDRRCLDDRDQLLKNEVDVTSPLLLIKARDVADRKGEQRGHDNERMTPGDRSEYLLLFVRS